MPNNRILTLALVLLVAPPIMVAAWMNQKKLTELRAIPAYSLPGKVIMFHSPRCCGCSSMIPLAKELQNAGFPLQSVNINEDSSMAAEYGIRRIPTFIYFLDGKEKYRVQSRMNRSTLEDFCRGINGLDSL
jgi:thiol-disulfide isomerase/thioredoxin